MVSLSEKNRTNTIVIAEAGVNHNGNLDLAFQLIDQAKISGADVVKFQCFNASKMSTSFSKKADYQKKSTPSEQTHTEMLASLELRSEEHERLYKHCNSCGIQYMSSAFDSYSLDFLVGGLGVEKLKIASGELTNSPFVLSHARTGKDILLSTGMCTLAEIEFALSVLAFGFVYPTSRPTEDALIRAYLSDDGQDFLKRKVTLLHCTSEYPAPLNEVNLKAMKTIGRAFNLPVGYSDHTRGNEAAIAAVSLGAKYIEKHLTVDKNLPGPDHQASMNPNEFGEFVKSIRNAEKCLGSSIKGPSDSEYRNKDVARKSLVALVDIEIGGKFTESNIGVKRPGSGVRPHEYWRYLDRISSRKYSAGDLLRE